MPINDRYVHNVNITAISSPRAYEQGQKQAEVSLERYHYLCAAATQKFSIVRGANHGMPFAREKIEFSAYTAYPLKTIDDLKMHVPRDDGTVHPRDIDPYVALFRKNWKCREGGIMYCIGSEREFWNVIMHYHSSPRTTRLEEWDDLLLKLKTEGPKPAIVPCMFFAREAGCLDPRCPFLHDKEACIRDREDVLRDRRETLDNVTSREVMRWFNRETDEFFSRHPPSLRDRYYDGADVPEVDQIRREMRRMKHACANPECRTVQWKVVPEGRTQTELKKCGKCSVTFYCTTECQRKDWKRHKAEPCLPYDELVNNDDLWTDYGIRKGTGNPVFNFADEE